MSLRTYRPNRRGFLAVGALTGMGLTLGDYFAPAASPGRAKELRLHRGQGQERDPHLPAGRHRPPGNVRSQALRPDRVSRRNGLDPSDQDSRRGLLARRCRKTAQIADKITVIRSMSHGEAAHERGTHNMFTGSRPSPALVYPSMGSVVSHEYGPRNNLPPYVCIPNQPNEFAGTGYLSSSFGPFSLGSDPASGNFTVRDLNLPNGVDAARFDRRRSALEAVNDLLCQEGKVRHALGHEHLLRSGLQPDQLASRPARRSTSRPSPRRFATNTAATRPASGC